MPHYSGEAYPFPALHPYLRQVYDAFGPHRMFWGTDITKMPCSWRQCVTMFTEELPWLKRRDHDWSWATRSAPGGAGTGPPEQPPDYCLPHRVAMRYQDGTGACAATISESEET